MAAPALSRSNSAMRKGSVMRPPSAPKPGLNRAQTATPTLQGRAAFNDMRQRSPKRKAQELDMDTSNVQETNINVVVRCRGRNDREVRENSAVVVSSDGIKGKQVELSMGPNALSNKAYQFDKVFSPAADQGMLFDEVVTPILDSLLAGLNCTIFAYGQTGTGKTYTMSGDIADILPIPEAAGIIPRVLHTLFARLNQDEASKLDTTVKCSFIELYNEELKDLLAYEQSAKLKIYDDASRNGRTTTLVQGMEETYIENASNGIRLLREGSDRRQVAATRCNDLSSRSHTVFTVTVCTKRIAESGGEHIVSSKLNLVDLAGSENIQRSGAEAQRATEAGLINKSLLTLGRVINALVDRSSHIPYRESKLTRLLQDSLGGQTKTCIIATLSPAKSNLEETISTLDYAFRAKNIRNKPQMNQLISKKTWLREFTAEIEKLKSELIATRHRNGHYLTAEAYEELTTQSESRRILSEEQRDKIETMDQNLRNKVQELYVLTTNFQSAKKDSDKVRSRLESTRDILDKTEIVLAHTKRSLADQTVLRKAHEATEAKLVGAHHDMQHILEVASDNAAHLQQKIDRTADLQSQNEARWEEVQSTIRCSGKAIQDCLSSTQQQQKSLLSKLLSTVQESVGQELRAIAASHGAVRLREETFDLTTTKINTLTETMQQDLTEILGEAHVLRGHLKEEVGGALMDLSDAAQRIGTGIAHELDAFQLQMQSAHDVLVQQLSTSFDDLTKRMQSQQEELDALHQQSVQARESYLEAMQGARLAFAQSIVEEQNNAKADREELVAMVGKLVDHNSFKQEKRLLSHIETSNKRIKISDSQYQLSQQAFDDGLAAWSLGNASVREASVQHRSLLHNRVQAQLNAAKTQIEDVATTSRTIHKGTTETIEKQMLHLGKQLSSLDAIVTKMDSCTSGHRQQQETYLQETAQGVRAGFKEVREYLDNAQSQAQSLVDDAIKQHTDIEAVSTALGPDGQPNRLLHTIQEASTAFKMLDDQSTGHTPPRTTYSYPLTLARTEPHDVILDRLRDAAHSSTIARLPTKSPKKQSPTKRSPSKIPISPSKPTVYNDPSDAVKESGGSSPKTHATLQEIDVNTMSVVPLDKEVIGCGKDSKLETPATDLTTHDIRPTHSVRDSSKTRKVRPNRTTVAAIGEGRENVMPNPLVFKPSIGGGPGRKLRTRALE